MAMIKSTVLLLIGVLAVCAFAQENQENEFGSNLVEGLSTPDVKPYHRSKRTNFYPSRAQEVRTEFAQFEIARRLARERADRERAQNRISPNEYYAERQQQQRNNNINQAGGSGQQGANQRRN